MLYHFIYCTIITIIYFYLALLDYLREESNIMPRVGAIGVGGLTGLILGLRGRTFKRLAYSSTGALAMAALCYPRKAEEGFNMAKHYVNVGYNFIYGGNVRSFFSKLLSVDSSTPEKHCSTCEYSDLEYLNM